MTASIKGALKRLLTSAKILQQNAEGCAANHYGADFQREGLPGWLRDTKADIDAAQSALASLSILATGLVPDEAAIRADEREKCAQEAFTAVTHVVIPDDGNTTLADHVAAAIRAGGSK